MFDDKPFVKDFGQAGKRDSGRLLDKLGGADGYKTGYTWTPNGWVRLQTHGGLPRTYEIKKDKETPEKIPDYYIFQVATKYTISWPSTPIPTTWEANHWLSMDPKIVLSEVSVTSRGNCEWFGNSPKVVTWFGLNSSGRQASMMFYPKASGLTTYQPLPPETRKDTRREAVWVDGEKWFDLPDEYAPVCAAMNGELLRVVAINQDMCGTTTIYAKDGTAGNHVASVSTSPLYLYEGTQDAMTLMRTIDIDIPEGGVGSYIFVQSAFFDKAGEKFAGIIGFPKSGTYTQVNICEFSFSSGAMTLNKVASKDVNKHTTAVSESLVARPPTGLPVSSPGWLIKNSNENGWSLGKEYPIAIEYRHSDGKLVALYRNEITGYWDFAQDGYGMYSDNDEYEFGFINVGDICDANLESMNAAYAAQGLSTPTPEYFIVAPNTPLPIGTSLPTPSGCYPGTTRSDGNTGYDRQEFIWWYSARKDFASLNTKELIDIHYELRDMDDSVISSGFKKRKYLKHLYCDKYIVGQHTRGPVTLEEKTVYRLNPTNGTTFPFVVTKVVPDSLSLAATYSVVGGDIPDPVEYEEDEYDIVAADLRIGVYVIKTPSGRNVINGFPSRDTGNWIDKEDSLPDEESEHRYLDLVNPPFGIEALTTYKNSAHVVFSKVDSWNSSPVIAHWSPSTGTTDITTGSPHEAPIYFKG